MACPEHGRWVAQDRRAIDDVPPRVGLHCLKDLEIVSILCGEPLNWCWLKAFVLRWAPFVGFTSRIFRPSAAFPDPSYSTAGAVVLCCALPLGRHTQPQRESEGFGGVTYVW